MKAVDSVVRRFLTGEVILKEGKKGRKIVVNLGCG